MERKNNLHDKKHIPNNIIIIIIHWKAYKNKAKNKSHFYSTC